MRSSNHLTRMPPFSVGENFRVCAVLPFTFFSLSFFQQLLSLVHSPHLNHRIRAHAPAHPHTKTQTEKSTQRYDTMGGWLPSLCAKPKHSILMLGPDYSGKTAILLRLKFGTFTPGLMPTIGFNVETFERSGYTITLFEYGGGDKLREITYLFHPDKHALIFVCNSSDPDEVGRACTELQQGLARERAKHIEPTPLLILAAQQDKAGAMSAEDVQRVLQLDTILDRPWHVQCCAAATGEGLEEGMSWLEAAICAPSSTVQVTTL